MTRTKFKKIPFDLELAKKIMSKEEEKAYLDDEWERLNGKEENKA